MDQYATFASPVEAVFTHLADPARLADWLPQVTRVEADPDELVGIGLAFAVTTHVTGDELLTAEVAAHEPPWLIAYRLLTAEPMLIRATCTTHDGGTRVHVHQTDAARPLQVDLARLGRALHRTGEPGGRPANTAPRTSN
jgi:uncharacterized protein YndB with AHSA1/START domain